MKPKKSKKQKPRSIEVRPAEMIRIYRRIRTLLLSRVKKAKPAGTDSKEYRDAVKDLYAYNRILNVCRNLTSDVDALKGVLELLNDATMTFVAPDVINKGKPN